MHNLLVVQVRNDQHGDLYAVAALAGAAVVVAGHVLDLPPAVPTMLVGAVLCFGIRLGSIRHGWSLPTAGSRGRLPKQQ